MSVHTRADSTAGCAQGESGSRELGYEIWAFPGQSWGYGYEPGHPFPPGPRGTKGGPTLSRAGRCLKCGRDKIGKIVVCALFAIIKKGFFANSLMSLTSDPPFHTRCPLPIYYITSEQLLHYSCFFFVIVSSTKP